MRRLALIRTLAFAVVALLCGSSGQGRAASDPQQFDARGFQAANAKATEYCTTLWSDHTFDPLRDKIPLLGEPPTSAMLTSPERVRSEDKPLADLALKTLEKCKAALAIAWAMLPAPAHAKVLSVVRKADALNIQLYTGKITFGEYNVKRIRILKEMALAFVSIWEGPAAEGAQSAATVLDPTPLPPAKPSGPTASAMQTSAPKEVRIALVIGESRYLNLPRFLNPENDARSVAETFQNMGYNTQLLLDAPEESIRREIRKFASASGKADIAVVFYAGHAAQLNGSNYLLPIDVDIPHTEADIQFAGLKLDDLVNSIGSNTKIVFLDACRDNPALFKNLVHGRGSSPVGLAPAIASNFSPAKPGGGIFIAYATEAGAVADDGHGQHSPFAQALLRNMQKPISIDDMFSLVTKEVRLVTKNTQRPFKYASLESIVCLTPICSGSPVTPAADIIQQTKESETDEMQIALQTNNADALEAYLQKYPETSKRSEILSKIGSLKRSEFTEWTLYEIGDHHMPHFIQLSSIRTYGDRAAAKIKQLTDPSKPTMINDKTIPDAVYLEDLNVYDCPNPAMAIAEESAFAQSGKLLYHFKWADPRYLNLSIGTALPTGSVGLTGRYIACHEDIATPLVSKKQIADMKFDSLSSTSAGDGEIFYELTQTGPNVQGQKQVLMILRNDVDHNVKEFLPQDTSIPDPPNFRTEVDRVLFKCDENKFAIERTEFWNAANQLVRLQFLVPAAIHFSDFQELSPFGTLQKIVCGKGYAGVGIRLALDGGLIRVAEVFDSSPAEKGGMKVDDTITHINDEAVTGLTLEQVIVKLRGSVNTQVVLGILRKGQADPVKITLVRENIQPLATQLGIPK